MNHLILADDLTGAADCALAFAACGHPAEVLLDLPRGARPLEASVLSIDLDTRHQPAPEAAARMLEGFKALSPMSSPLYKKIDSTLRGPWAAEVAALQPVAGVALVAPTYPAQGRTVKGGRLLIDGQPLEDTTLWKLARSDWPPAPVEAMQRAGLRTAAIDAHAHLDEPRRLAAALADLVSQGAQAIVCDAESEEALATLAAADTRLTFRHFWAGSAGMATALARREILYRAGDMGGLTPLSCAIVTVVGSLSEVTDRQCARLVEACPVETVVVAPADLRRESPEVRKRIARAFAQQAHLVVRIGREGESLPDPEGALAAGLAAYLRPHAHRVGAWILTGGETAREVLRMAGIDRLRVLEAIEPGIALAQGIRPSGSWPHVVTKAGAFGSDASLERAWRRVNQLQIPHVEGTKA